MIADVGSAQEAEAAARGRSRIRRALTTSASSLVARLTALGSFLVIVYLTVPYLGSDRYGVWMTALSLVGVLSLANLGMGNTLISLIAGADAGANEAEAGRLVSSALAVVAFSAFVLGGGLALAFLGVPWDTVLNAQGSAASEANGVVAVVLAAFVVSVPIGLVAQIRSGYQEGYVTGWCDVAGSIVSVLLVGTAVAFDLGLLVLIAAAAVAPMISAAANLTLLLKRRPTLRPRLAKVSRVHARLLLRTGGLFLVLQLAVLVAYSSHNFITAHVLGSSAVTQYSIPSRLAFAGIALITVFLTPLWPAYSDALARGDRRWALGTLRRSMWLAAFASLLGALIFLVGGGVFVDAWSRGVVEPSLGLRTGLACWIVLGSVGAALAMFLNAAHVVGPQVICSVLMASTNIVLSIVLAQRFGVAGVIWGTVIAYSVFIVLPYCVLIPRVVRRV